MRNIDNLQSLPNMPETPQIIIPDGLNLPLNKRKVALEKHEAELKENYDALVKQEALNKLFIFNKYVLGVEEGKQKLMPFHKELCNFVTDDMKRKKLILYPRGHLKSTLITIGYSTWRIIKNPNVRGLVLNATWQMAVDFLTEIKRHLRENPRLLELYGDVTENAPEWSADRITLSRTDRNIKGPTMWATGIESNLVGSHPDFIIFDDVVNRDNTTTKEQMEKIVLRYKDALDLLEPGGALIIIGTKWDYSDLYSWILEREKTTFKAYDVMVKKAYTGDLMNPSGFEALWPDKFSRNELLSRQREEGWRHFSAQYLNEIIPEEDAEFRREWFQYYDVEDIRGKQMQTIAAIDPAISLKKDADFTGIGVVGIDTFSDIYIKDLVRRHMKPSEIIAQMFILDELWHPNAWVIETTAYQKALSYAIREEMQKRRRYLPIIEMNQHERTKDQRIRGLQPLYIAKKIFHPKNHLVVPHLEDELTRFPRSTHDDMPDCISMCLDYLSPPKQKQKRFHHRYLY